jgi:hypothetical protein
MDDKAADKFPGFPFKNLINTRNRIVHKYWDVNEGVMYATATNNFPALQKVVMVIFAEDIKLMQNVAHKSVLDIISKIHGDNLSPEDVAKAIDEAMKVQKKQPTFKNNN